MLSLLLAAECTCALRTHTATWRRLGARVMRTQSGGAVQRDPLFLAEAKILSPVLAARMRRSRQNAEADGKLAGTSAAGRLGGSSGGGSSELAVPITIHTEAAAKSAFNGVFNVSAGRSRRATCWRVSACLPDCLRACKRACSATSGKRRKHVHMLLFTPALQCPGNGQAAEQVVHDEPQRRLHQADGRCECAARRTVNCKRDYEVGTDDLCDATLAGAAAATAGRVRLHLLRIDATYCNAAYRGPCHQCAPHACLQCMPVAATANKKHACRHLSIPVSLLKLHITRHRQPCRLGIMQRIDEHVIRLAFQLPHFQSLDVPASAQQGECVGL